MQQVRRKKIICRSCSKQMFTFCCVLRHHPRENRYSRWSCCKSRHPWLEQSTPENKRVFPNKNKVNQLQDSELVEKNSTDNSYDEESELRHHEAEVRNAQNFGTNYASYSDWWNPIETQRIKIMANIQGLRKSFPSGKENKLSNYYHI